MKKIILTTIIVLTTIAISKSQKNNYSDLTLANIEALATNESILRLQISENRQL